MPIFGRFTEKAQKVLVLSQEEAQKIKHNYIGSEHLLLGLIQEGEGMAAVALRNLGVEYNKVREQIIKIVGEGKTPGQEIAGYTPRTKQILELSLMEARALKQSYIGTEHILLGLTREGEGIGARILLDMNISFEKVREEIIKLMNTSYTAGNPGSAKTQDTKNLNKYGTDLTNMAEQGQLDPVIGREKEIQRVIQILSRRTKNNPCLIGEPGVGKTAIAEGLAQKIVEGNIPENIKDKRLISLDLSSMVAGAKYRGEFEDRLKNVMEEIKNSDDVILFIDEMHTIIGAGAAEGAIDASNILKPALSRGELQTIGATTLDEYKKHIEKDAALERRFQPVDVGEPTKEEAVKILEGLRDRYEAHHKVTITDEALTAAVELSDRYINDRYLPDKAIDLIDEAASKKRLSQLTAPPNIKEIEDEVEKYKQEKEEAVAAQDFEKAAEIRDKEKKEKERLEEIKDSWKQENKISANAEVGYEEIADIVGSWTGVPVKKLSQDESERLLDMEEVLHKRVVGQEEAVKSVSRAIRRARVGLKDPNRPIGSFIFLGPTGVGKTELSKALAEVMFGDDDAMIRIDMSEYMEKHTVSRLIGSPPGYVGFDEGGQLTEKVRRKPYSVILLDEIEKAHPDVFNILLQILEDGRLTDGKGRTVDFKNSIIIMTSNVGARTIRRQKTLGFSVSEDKAESEYEQMKDNVMDELRKTFRPEFLNRIDEIIVFHQLQDQHIQSIIEIMLKQLTNRLDEMEIELSFDQLAKDYISSKGTNLEYGARPLRRTIQKEVEDKLSEEMLKGKVNKGSKVKVSTENEELKFETI